MKKLVILTLCFCVLVAVSCKKKLGPDALQSGNPADLITTNGSGSTGSLSAVEAFINEHAGVYYSKGEHWYRNWGVNAKNNGYKVDYKFRNGKVYKLNPHNQAAELAVQPVEAVLPSANKLQLNNYQNGEILVLNMTDKGLESYVSYILEKVSDDVLIENAGVGGSIPEFAKYKGTYNSMAKDNKIANYIAIDEEGNIFFHDANVTIESERVSITDGELTILEAYNKTMRKIIFKFDQGVYRRYSIDGENRDETYIGICEVTKDFIEDIFYDALFATSDFKREGRNTAYGFYPTKITGISLKLNEENNNFGHTVSEGAVAIDGNNIGDDKRVARGDMVGHVSILKGNTLHIMGRYNAKFVFSDDWKTATYNGQTLNLVKGEIKTEAAAKK